MEYLISLIAGTLYGFVFGIIPVAGAATGLITIYGLSGIGKTTLTRYLIQTLQPEFEAIIWRSFYTSPSLEITLKNLLLFLDSCLMKPNK